MKFLLLVASFVLLWACNSPVEALNPGGYEPSGKGDLQAPNFGDSMDYGEDSDESYEEHKSWMDEMKASIAGMTTGILLVCVSFPFLFWNEGRSVVRSQILGMAQEQLVELEKPSMNPANDGKLVACHGKVIASADKQKDEEFGINSKSGDLKLKRTVEMYQWKEESKESKDNVGGGKTTKYSYKKTWSAFEIDDSQFKQKKHRNPRFDFKTETFSSRSKLGDFNLHPQLLGACSDYKPLSLRKSDVPAAPPALSRPRKGYGSTDSKPAKLHASGGNEVFLGANPNKPEIGDYKLLYTSVKTGVYSVLGQQSGEQLMSFTLEGVNEPELPCLCGALCCAGAACVRSTAGTIDSAVEGMIEQNDEESGAHAHINAVRAVEPGQHTGLEMLMILTKRNACKLMAYRAVGYCMMTFGLYLCVKPIETLFSVIGFLGEITGWVLLVFCSLVACVASLGVMATAWFYYRPMVALCLVGVAGAFVYMADHYLNNHEHIHQHVHEHLTKLHEHIK